MSSLISSIERGETRPAATIGLRLLGAALLGLCWLSAGWTVSLVHRGAQIPALAPAMLTVACWSTGWAFAILGPRLFRLVPPPPRPFYRTF